MLGGRPVTDPICVLAGGRLLTLAASSLTLSWFHSVEHTRWTEYWTSGPAGLTLVEATVQGSGAGMEPPDGAVAGPTGWTYRPRLPPVRHLMLAASGATG
jgi:hypothetical protein